MSEQSTSANSEGSGEKLTLDDLDKMLGEFTERSSSTDIATLQGLARAGFVVAISARQVRIINEPEIVVTILPDEWHPLPIISQWRDLHGAIIRLQGEIERLLRTRGMIR
jgi:hypothetical protein